MSRIRLSRPIVATPVVRLSSAALTARGHLRRRYRIVASSSGGDENGGPPVVQKNAGIRETVADLDAILGIEEEPETPAPAAEPQPTDTVSELSASTEEEIRSLAEEVTRKLNDEAGVDKQKEEDFIEKMTKIVKSATSNAEGASSGKDILESLEQLLESVGSPKDETNEDIKVMKERVFGADTFWVTEVVIPNDEFGGHRFRGNLRRTNEHEVFQEVESRVKELFGEKYEVMMFEDVLTPDQLTEANPQPKICFQVIPAETAQPPKSPSWRPVLMGVLFLFTLATSYVLGVSSNVGNIPEPIVKYLSNPENFNADPWPDFVRNWDASSFLASSATVAAGVVFLQLMHEAGHRVVAFLKKIRLKGSIFLPNTQIGTLGSTTQLDSLVKTRQDLWDLAFSGLAVGGISSLVLLLTGLMLAQDGSVPREALIPVPSVLLQGSTLIGGLLQFVLGDAASARTILLHPFTVAGWCGLTTTALNALPVGNLDGGRMMLSAYGKRPLNVTSIFTYAGLALGVIAGSLALPFGLYVLIIDRDPEAYIQNQVTPTERTRQWITAASIVFAVLILLPLGLFDATEAGLGPGSPLI